MAEKAAALAPESAATSRPALRRRKRAVGSMAEKAAGSAPESAATSRPAVPATMDEAESFRRLAQWVAPSVITVERTQTSGLLCAGCVIHKTKNATFVLSQSGLQQELGLLVHFSNGSAKSAECIASGEWFIILAIEGEHDGCKPVSWVDPIIDSDALMFIPKSTSNYEKAKGFISGFCTASAGTATPASEIVESKLLFIASCHHGHTEMMVSTPVFTKNGKANGVVISDCFFINDGAPQKICISTSRVIRELKLMTGNNNWQDGLVNLFDKLKEDKRKRKHKQSEAGGEASLRKKAARHKKVQTS